jgi:hypothetical protein
LFLIFSYTHLTRVPNKRVSTIIVKGPTHHAVRSCLHAVHNTLSVLRNTFEDCVLIPGGGSVEMAIAGDIRKHVQASGLFQERIKEAFANALEHSVPLALCQNSGYNVYRVLSEWKAKSENAPLCALDLYHTSGRFIDPVKSGIWDSARVKLQVMAQSIEIVNVLLKIDTIAKAGDLRKHSVVIPQDSVQETSEKNWKYQRYHPSIDKGGSKWTKREKEKLQKREEKFYSEEAREKRKRMDKVLTVEDTEAARNNRLRNLAQEQVQKQRQREAGFGYNVDPFQ